MIVAKKIFVRGIVQGVGFRPKVFTYAKESQVNGWVKNTSAGVEIMVEGTPARVEKFISKLRVSPPPLAKVDSFVVSETLPIPYKDFTILESQSDPLEFIPISPDIAICPECKKEMFNPKDRRYRYPFINCTNCGPRFSIIRDIPYDRPLTSMAGFDMCPECKAEYTNPENRRFHAQPIACPTCGPQLWYEYDGKVQSRKEDALQMARKEIKTGRIVAVKGLGGYLLACDGTNPKTVYELRKRKNRVQKPFALMAWDVEVIKKYCQVSKAEEALLSSPQSPIVLLVKKPGIKLPDAIAPGQTSLGFMLPYTPLHLLLMEPESGYPNVLIMTSGNQSEEPIAYQDDEARERLASLADGFLMHNRPIEMRTDDSVSRVVENHPYLIRRARGFAPNPVQLPTQVLPILAVGGEMKNTFCLSRDNYAFMSHHIGEMDSQETFQSFESGIEHFEKIFRINPHLFACDLHPDYLSSNYARKRSCAENKELIQIQHHHAHLAACLADNGWKSDEQVIGLCFDGTGYGTDGAIWGGEFLVGNYAGFNRVSHFSYLPLPGGDAAIQHPWRIAAAYLQSSGLEWENDLPPFKGISLQETQLLEKQLQKKINTPPTSSLGRLFDAVSALVGVCENTSYEGQAAIELEAVLDPNETGAYEFEIAPSREIEIKKLLTQVVRDIHENVPVGKISAHFHNGLNNMISTICESVRKESGIKTVALSGGVWQNRSLLTSTIKALTNEGFQILWHHQVPTNDGGIALGQTMIAHVQSQR
jgi:hydrogenase maturation protein HypF